MGRAKRVWYLSPMQAAKVQASLRIRAVSPEPPLLAHTSRESRETFRQKARSLAPLNGWACAVKICNDGMLEDTNSLDGAHMIMPLFKVRFAQRKCRYCNGYDPVTGSQTKIINHSETISVHNFALAYRRCFTTVGCRYALCFGFQLSAWGLNYPLHALR